MIILNCAQLQNERNDNNKLIKSIPVLLPTTLNDLAQRFFCASVSLRYRIVWHSSSFSQICNQYIGRMDFMNLSAFSGDEQWPRFLFFFSLSLFIAHSHGRGSKCIEWENLVNKKWKLTPVQLFIINGELINLSLYRIFHIGIYTYNCDIFRLIR